jgi:exosortase
MTERGSSRAPWEPTWGAIVTRAGGVEIAVVAGLVAWLYWDQIARMVVFWRDPDWMHGYLILPFSLYLLHTRRRELARVAIRPSWVGLGVLLVGIAGYGVAVLAKIGYPQPLSMLVVISGAVLLMGGWGLLRQTLFPICFLALAMPPPDRLYRAATQPLQQLAAQLAQALLNVLPDIDVERSGFQLTAYAVSSGRELASFAVAGACSGMRSLMAFVAIGLAMAYLTPRPLWHRMAMAVIVFPVALSCNIVRVIVTGVFLIYDKGNLAEGTPHMVLGLLTFGLGMLIYSLAIHVLDRLFLDDDETPQAAPPAGEAVS